MIYRIEFIQKSKKAITMKSESSNPKSKIKNSPKNQHKFFHPHKEFELLYRSCDQVHPSEKYQSVFFMKHKKISQEQNDRVKEKGSKRKQGGKKKNYKEKEQNIESHLQKFSKIDKMEATKTTIPSSTTDKFIKSSFVDNFRKTIDLKKSEIKKVNPCNSSSSRYLNPKSIMTKRQEKMSSGKLKKQTPARTIRTVKSPKKVSSPKNSYDKVHHKTTTAFSKRMKSRTNINIVNIKEDKCYIEDDDNDHQYILIEGRFVEAETPDFQYLEEKLRYQEEQARNQFVESFVNLQMNCSSPVQSQKVDSFRKSCDISVLYLQKIIKIQRWWRKISKKSQKNEKILIRNSPFQQNPHPQTQSDEDIEKTMSNFILVKERTIVNYMNHKKKLFNKLLHDGKMTKKEYSERMSEVQEAFQTEMREIFRMREMLHHEVENIRNMEEEIKEEERCAGIQQTKVTALNIAEKILNAKKHEKAEKDHPKNGNGFLTPPTLHDITNRKKSTGCHIGKQQQTQLFDNQAYDIEISPLANKKFFQQQKSEEDDSEQYPSSEGGNQLQQIFEIYQDRQQAQSQIEKRHAIQLGMRPSESGQYQVQTSVLGIHKFLTSFLQFYSYFFKQQFLKMINMPYGYSQKIRLKILQGSTQNLDRYSILDDQESIIGSEILEDYHQHEYQTLGNGNQNENETARAMIYFEQIHNRAIFDSFNEELNSFRPYFYINGPPYTWNYSQRALTFYYIAEENIQEVFQKTQYKVLKNSSYLCGALVQPLINDSKIAEQICLEEKLAKYREAVNPVLAENREQKLAKVQKQEICENNYQWEDCEQEKVSALIEISNLVFEKLFLELSQDLL